MVHSAGWRDALGNVPSTEVNLQEVAPCIGFGAGQAPVPHVGDEEGDVSRFGDEGHRLAAHVLEVGVVRGGRGAAREMTAGQHPCRSALQGAIHQEDMNADCKHRVGNIFRPHNTWK